MKLLKYLSLSLLLMNAAAFTMERESSVVPVQQFATLQGLPADIKKLVVDAIVASGSLNEAVVAISNLTKIGSNQFNALINDPKTIEVIIKELAKRFNISEILVAAKLDTYGSQVWLSNQVLQDETGSAALFKAIELHDVVAVKNLLKAGVDIKALLKGRSLSPLDALFARITSYYPSTKKVSEYDKVIFKALIDAGAQFNLMNSALINNLGFAPHMPALEKELGIDITKLLPR